MVKKKLQKNADVVKKYARKENIVSRTNAAIKE
jgi:hypothetical protein